MRKMLIGGVILSFLFIGCYGNKSEEINSFRPHIDDSPIQKDNTSADNMVGSWNWSIIDAIIILKKNQKNYILETQFKDGSNLIKNVTLKTIGNLYELRVIDDNPRGEYYKINVQGDLEFWDNEGKSGNAIVIKKLKL